MPSKSPASKNADVTLFKDQRAWVIVTFALGLLFGGSGGAYWAWKASELSTAVSTTDLRKAQGETYQRIIALSAEYLPAQMTYARSKDEDEQVLVLNKMKRLDGQLVVEKANFLALETKLAKLEGREPQVIRLDFILPLPPMNIRVSP